MNQDSLGIQESEIFDYIANIIGGFELNLYFVWQMLELIFFRAVVWKIAAAMAPWEVLLPLTLVNISTIHGRWLDFDCLLLLLSNVDSLIHGRWLKFDCFVFVIVRYGWDL